LLDRIIAVPFGPDAIWEFIFEGRQESFPDPFFGTSINNQPVIINDLGAYF